MPFIKSKKKIQFRTLSEENWGGLLNSQFHHLVFVEIRLKMIPDLPEIALFKQTSGSEYESDNKAVFHLQSRHAGCSEMCALINVSRCWLEQEFS